MCMVLYVAADAPLPLVPWAADAPAFHVTVLPPRAAAVRAHFSKPHVYYLGSHEGCGCGFGYGWWDGEDPESSAQGRESVGRLGAYLAAVTQASGPVELYACWSGDERAAAAPERAVARGLRPCTAALPARRADVRGGLACRPDLTLQSTGLHARVARRGPGVQPTSGFARKAAPHAGPHASRPNANGTRARGGQPLPLAVLSR